jgi:hypothetical protein
MNHRAYALILGSLAFAFFLRVLGQILVALNVAPFLPPMHQWYSGLLAYPVLLTSQIIILGLQALIFRDLWCGEGFFARPYPRFGRAIHWFAVVYFTVMVARYILTMAWNPEMRWFSGTIPIFFHWVLAAYLWVWARFHRQQPAPLLRQV